MASDDVQQRILIADTDAMLNRELVTGYNESRRTRERPPVPIFVDTVHASQSKLSDRDFAYAGVFVCPTIGSPSWVAVVRAAHRYRPGIPIFILYDKTMRLSQSQLEGLGVTGFIEKPMSYARVLKLLGEDGDEELETDHPNFIPDISKPPEEHVSYPMEGDGPTDEEVVQVDLSNIAGRIKSTFDVFIKLADGKYVWVLKAGDVLSADRIESYKTRGAQALYVRKLAQGAFIEFCDEMVAEALNDPAVPSQVKTTQVLAQGESTMRLLRDAGVTERSIQRAQVFVSNTTEMIKQIADQNAFVKQLMKDIAALEHSVAVTTLAGLMIRHLGGSNPAVYNAVGIACFFHDIALIGQPPEVRDEDPKKMSPEQLVIFNRHPEESAKIVMQMPKVPQSVLQAIAQHHMRQDGSGFPKKTKDNEEVNRLAELIGISEEYLRLAIRARDEPDLRPLDALRAYAEKRFSEPIVDAFVRTFAEQ